VATWIKSAMLIAFPPQIPDPPPTTPSPVPPLRSAGALREGALLFEHDSEAVSKIHAA
jgi:hypothetical protein